jgi:deoxyribodipyrimidine photolyase
LVIGPTLAGVGNDPRKHRYFNIEKQAKDYDKDSVRFMVEIIGKLIGK